MVKLQTWKLLGLLLLWGPLNMEAELTRKSCCLLLRPFAIILSIPIRYMNIYWTVYILYRRRRDYPKTATPTVIGSDRERREERPEGTSRIHDGYYQSEAARPPSVHEQRHSEAEPNNYHYQEEEEQNNVNTMKTEDNHISNHNNYGSDAYSSHRRSRSKSNHDSPAERESERPSSKYRNSKRDANDNDIEAGQVEVYDRIPDAREEEDDDSSSEYTVHYEGRRE